MNVFIFFFASLRKLSSIVNIGIIALLKLIISIDFIKANLERQGKNVKSQTEEFLMLDRNQDQFFAEFMFGVYLYNIFLMLINLLQIIFQQNFLYTKDQSHLIIIVFILGVIIVSILERRFLTEEKVSNAIFNYQASDKKYLPVLLGITMFLSSFLLMASSFLVLLNYF